MGLVTDGPRWSADFSKSRITQSSFFEDTNRAEEKVDSVEIDLEKSSDHQGPSRTDDDLRTLVYDPDMFAALR